MLIGQRCIPVPEPDPRVASARSPAQAGLLRNLHDDVLWDVLAAHTREPRTATDCHVLDVIRAEFARRHRPVELEGVCSKCLYALEHHDEFDSACPTDQPYSG